jgi:hypothetical protein
MKKRTLVTSLTAVTLIGGMTACAGEQPAEVVEAPVAESAGAAEIDPRDESEAVEPAVEPSPEFPSHPVGTTAEVGDWQVTVSNVDTNANGEIEKANQFNEPADDQYVLVHYTAKYVGAERTGDAEMDLSWSFTDAAQVTHDWDPQVTPTDSKGAPTEARKGGTVTLDVLFDIPADAIEGGIISVEGYDADYTSVYADFTF